MQTSDTIKKKKVLLLTVVFAMRLSYRTCSDFYLFISLNSWCVPVWSQPHLSAVNRRLWRRRWKGSCARAQSDLVEGFGYRLKIKPTHLTFAADSSSLSQCLCGCRAVLFAGGVGRGEASGGWRLLLFYLPVGGDQAPHVWRALTASAQI